MTRYFCFLLLLIVAAGCECEHQSEHRLALRLYRDGSREEPAFSRIYGLGGDGDLHIARYDSLYRLPLSMHQDSSTYVMDYPNGDTDTLTITYTRDFLFESRSCGFVIKYHDYAPGQSTTIHAHEIVITDNIFRNEVRIYR